MPITVRDLGMGGVNVDSNPLDLQDTELSNSQNATLGDLKGRATALVKRRGLEKLNQSSLGGAILGGIEAPYQGTAAAPANGSGGGIINTGDPNLGTGVAPGGSTSVPGNPGSGGSQGNTGQSVGSSAFSPTPLFGGGRITVQGIDTNLTVDTGEGFIVMPAGWGSTGTIRFADGVQMPLHVGPDCNANQSIVFSPSAARIFRCFTIANGACYFAHGDPAEGGSTSNPAPQSVVRISADGKSITKIIDIPDNSSIVALANPHHRSFITAIDTEYGNGDAVWIAVWDEIRSGIYTGHYGRVLRLTGLDSGAYALAEVYNSFTTVGGSLFNTTPTIPFCITSFLGNMWMGVVRGTSTGSAPAATMFRPNPVFPNGWENTRNVAASSTSWADITCMKTYNGTLYIGYGNRNPSVAAAVIASLDAAGAYTSPVVTGSAGTPDSPACWVSMEIFNGKLYATYSNGVNGMAIYQFDGTSWTIVATPSGGAYLLWADGTNGIYAWAGTPLSTTRSCLFSTDGTTWVEKGINFAIGGAGRVPVNMMFAFDQS